MARLHPTEYYLSYKQEDPKWLRIKSIIHAENELTTLNFPTWRPGRYERGDFAKNLKSVRFFLNGKKIDPAKKSTNHWEINTQPEDKIEVEYLYYADQLNAGATFSNHEMVFITPCNFCIYEEGDLDNECKVELDFPNHWQSVGYFPQGNHQKLKFDSIHAWFDNPILFGQGIQSNQYRVEGVDFHIHFWGETKPNWDKILKNFVRFTKQQIIDFGSFPAKEYHFINLVTPHHFYHGVEHVTSTAIAIGPGCQLMGERYDAFLGVSSHELYHAWNVKTIRPAEWQPYEYDKEQYSQLGFIAEGITTFMGDYYLLKSGVWDIKRYQQELTQIIQRHQDNFGRLNLSVADSSFELWLDGYEKGVPERKVSIYNEGALLAFCVDIQLRKKHPKKAGISELMREWYEDKDILKNGVSLSRFKSDLESKLGTFGKEIVEKFYLGTDDYNNILIPAVEDLGWAVEEKPSSTYAESHFGFKMNSQHEVTDVYPGSYAEQSGVLVGDKLISVNNYPVQNCPQDWLEMYHLERVSTTWERQHLHLNIELQADQRLFYKEYKVVSMEEPNLPQRQMLNAFTKKQWDKK